MRRILHSILEVEIYTELDDDESSAETVEFLVKEDLEDLGYEIESIKTLAFSKTEREK